MTFELAQQLLDEILLVSEEQIASAMRLLLDKHHKVVEGAAAATVAAILDPSNVARFRAKNVIALLCGGNVSTKTLKQVLL